MTITLFKTSDDKRVVNKTLTELLSVDCNVYNSCDIYSPSLLLEYNTDVYEANYMYIPTFKRYYFINNITLDAGQRMIVSGSIDVLYTYASSIKTLDATVVRNENVEDNLLVDPLATFTPNKTLEVFKFPETPFNARDIGSAHNFVLVIGGGYSSGN